MANNSDVSEIKLILLNLSALQQQNQHRLDTTLSAQFDTLLANLNVLTTSVNTLIEHSTQKDAVIADLTAQLQTAREALQSVDSPDKIAAVADNVGKLSIQINNATT